jgi:hypothetical protein
VDDEAVIRLPDREAKELLPVVIERRRPDGHRDDSIRRLGAEDVDPAAEQVVTLVVRDEEDVLGQGLGEGVPEGRSVAQAVIGLTPPPARSAARRGPERDEEQKREEQASRAHEAAPSVVSGKRIRRGMQPC